MILRNPQIKIIGLENAVLSTTSVDSGLNYQRIGFTGYRSPEAIMGTLNMVLTSDLRTVTTYRFQVAIGRSKPMYSH